MNSCIKIFLLAISCLALHAAPAQTVADSAYFRWDSLSTLPPVGDQPRSLGVAGPIAGVHEGVLIVAGGANFPEPFWDNDKQWHDDIWLWMTNDQGEKTWLAAGKLDHPLGYPAVVSTSVGLLIMGGSDGRQVFDEVLLLRWNPVARTLEKEYLPPLPAPCVYGSAAVVDGVVYLAGGSSGLDLSTAMTNFWRLDLNNYKSRALTWEELPAWPGPERAFSITVAQHDGFTSGIYVMTGRRTDPTSGAWVVLQDVYEFRPEYYRAGDHAAWQKRRDMPQARMAGTAAAVGQSHIFVLSGADGSLYQQADALRERHPGFPATLLAYHTITDTWFEAGKMPVNQLTTPAFQWGADICLVSGEVKPRQRSPRVWKLSPVSAAVPFGWANGLALLVYLLLLVGIGIFFAGRNKDTEDFFRGGQRIPWWAAGCSIFATMLSSVTFMAVPAKAYATNWVYFLINMSIIALAPFIIHFILPFFRRIDATSAYQYLELRFNLAARLFASASYILFQLGRMAIVLYLPALALAAVMPISIELCILVMGLFSILYATLGGLEAVVWTDTLQTIVLLGGALLSLLLVVLSPEMGGREFFAEAAAADKFRMVDTGWSYTGTALWVVILGGIGQTLIPYTSDQGVVQRYMSVATDRMAARSIWTNAVLSLLATLLFFGVGTALFVFYRQHPTATDPTLPTDAVFPLFIARQLPVGIAGMVIAGLFAAAQSTVSTSMNSIAAAFTTDFLRRFALCSSEVRYLAMARWATVTSGLLGTGFALLIAYANIRSLWDAFIGILGLLGGAMCGLFLLGIFVRRANGRGALTGAVGGVVSLWLVQQHTSVSFLLYAVVGIAATVLIGWLASYGSSAK